MNLKGRNFLTLKDFTPEEIIYLLDLAAELKEKKKKGSIVINILKQRKKPESFMNITRAKTLR